MNTITINGRKYGSRDDETILESLLRQGVPVRYSCKKGACGTCESKALEGEVFYKSSSSVNRKLTSENSVLLCVAQANSDIKLDDSAIDMQKFGEQESEYEYREELKLEIPKPDLGLWRALGEGKLLLEILKHFYARVYEDPRLAPFFHSTTIERAIGKQYSFLQELITGEKIYFGSYPRTAHHWMVIDEELFEYREALLKESMIVHGLSEDMINRWRSLHDAFKAMILKKRPWQKIIGGVVVPLTGFDTMIAEFDMLCDSCQKEINIGERAGYHQEDAKVYCSECSGLK